MQRSVSETRRSVATRPYRSSSACVVTASPTESTGRAATDGPTRTVPARITSRRAVAAVPAQPALGRCSRSSVGAAGVGRLAGSASGSSTGSRTARSATRSSSATRPRRRRPSPRSWPRAARSPRPTSGGVVTATGTYAADDTVIVRYRTRDGASGVDVVVPLVTADGTALLVDRGWMATDNRGTDAASTCPLRRPAR